LIPFLGQQEKTAITVSSNQKVKTEIEQPSYSFKKEVKKLQTPTGQLQSSLISIKELTAPKVDDQSRNEPIENRPQTPFSSDELKISWKKFAFTMKSAGNDTMYLAMIKRDPKIGANFQLIHEVDNQVQIDYIQTHLSDLIDFLRESLNNWKISINFSISENQEESLKHQTGKDKFNALARKNPNLHTFQKTFNLDIEY
jgi:DNA polymerase-3 subunit gamma/tau